MTTVLIAGATGTLGSLIARQLLDLDAGEVRLLVRDLGRRNDTTWALLGELTALGATVVTGDLSDTTTLDAATRDVDTVVSAVQGRRDIIVDGQIALAEAAVRSGVRRFIASDFAIDLFAAPDGAPQFDLRKEAAAAIEAMDIDVVHILNGGFMDLMLDPASTGMIDAPNGVVRMWGTGDETFNLTTLDDTARFTARAAIDSDPLAGVFMVSGSETSFNEIATLTESATGSPLTRQVMGDASDLRLITAAARSEPWSVAMQWSLLSMLTVPAFRVTENERYPGLELTTVGDYLTKAHTS